MLTKKHKARLIEMLARMDFEEFQKQKRFGDRIKGSMRSSRVRDADALRAALVELGVVVEVQEVAA